MDLLIDGLARAATAVDVLLRDVRADLQAGLFPGKEDFAQALDIRPSMRDITMGSLLPSLRRRGVEPYRLAANFTRTLAELEEALDDLRQAVRWQSRFSGFSWWIRQRQRDLGISDYLVVPRPGPSNLFEITTDDSSVAHSFRAVVDFLYGAPAATPEGIVSAAPTELLEKAQALNRVRVLTVPQLDGGSPAWHPISLGHEIAHLRWRDVDVAEWLRTVPGVSVGPEAQQAITWASGSAVPLDWYRRLCDWLVEIGCDATLLHYYDVQGLRAFEAYARVNAVSGDSPTHPNLDLRLAILTEESVGALASHRTASENAGFALKNAFCDLAIPFRNHVRSQLGTMDGLELADSLFESTVGALANRQPPAATSWPIDLVREAPSRIETSLVRAYWQSEVQPEPSGTQSVDSRGLLINHAVDFLQFSHRFRVAETVAGAALDRPSGPLNSDPSRDPLTLANALWVTPEGVLTQPPRQYHSGTRPQGLASYDLRLGRYFIVFQRNEITVLDSFEGSPPGRAVQTEVEIGWDGTFVLHPGDLVLAVTLEAIIVCDHCAAQVLSRSSLGRMGLLSATAAHVHPGYQGFLTLELVNLAPVPLRLHPGQRVAQLVPFAVAESRTDTPSKYDNFNYRPQLSAVKLDSDNQTLRRLRDPEPGGNRRD